MARLCIYALYTKDGLPRCIGLRQNGITSIVDIYKAGSTIYRAKAALAKISRFIRGSTQTETEIVTSDVLSLLRWCDLQNLASIYDLHLPTMASSSGQDHQTISKILLAFEKASVLPYQQLIAGACRVYRDLEFRGVQLLGKPIFPQWSCSTWTGRSKTLGFNLHGATDQDELTAICQNNDQIMIHFDWIAADICAAAYLSGDERLAETFVSSDPYTWLMGVLNADQGEGQLSRSEAKLALLKAINSVDVDGFILAELFPRLGRWLAESMRKSKAGEAVCTLLGRKFYTKDNHLAVINGAMQGSVVHAMQRTISQVSLSYTLMAEIHDSIVVVVDQARVPAAISSIGKLMLNPLAGIHPANPSFPVKVSTGKAWRQWQPKLVYRATGLSKIEREISDV